MKIGSRLAGACVCLTMLVLLLSLPLAARQSQPPQVRQQARHASGQTVAPVFEGWAKNRDGTFGLYFSYMNRNYEEELDIPIGSNNAFDPGPPDRGQPTHFLPRHNRMVFSVTVPADFGNQKLTWILAIRGNVEKVSGSLNPLWLVDPFEGPPGYGSNKPPVVTVGMQHTVTLPAAVSLSASITDDGIPRPKSAPPTGVRDDSFVGSGPELTVVWSKYRGPGRVTFAPARQRVEGGKAATRATFSAPGDYILQMVTDDGSEIEGFQCCWTNRKITVTVKAGGLPQSQKE